MVRVRVSARVRVRARVRDRVSDRVRVRVGVRPNLGVGRQLLPHQRVRGLEWWGHVVGVGAWVGTERGKGVGIGRRSRPPEKGGRGTGRLRGLG